MVVTAPSAAPVISIRVVAETSTTVVAIATATLLALTGGLMTTKTTKMAAVLRALIAMELVQMATLESTLRWGEATTLLTSAVGGGASATRLTKCRSWSGFRISVALEGFVDTTATMLLAVVLSWGAIPARRTSIRFRQGSGIACTTTAGLWLHLIRLGGSRAAVVSKSARVGTVASLRRAVAASVGWRS